jgi:putative ABC transport system substrate-binding protein
VRGAHALLGFAVFWGAAGLAFAQAPAKAARIGVLANLAGANAHMFDAFFKGLGEHGYVEGRNLIVERRSYESKIEGLPALSEELVKAKVDVIFAPTTVEVRSAKAAGATMPIVFAVSADPVGEKFVASLRRPGGNITGLTIISGELVAKRIDLLAQAFPKASRLGFLVSSQTTSGAEQVEEAKRATARLGKELVLEHVRRDQDLDGAIENLRRQRIDALLISESVIAFRRRARIAELVAKAGWPAMYGEKSFAEAGGLISYGPNYADLFRRAAGHVAKILKGAKPGDLPVEQPTVFELAVNLKAAKAMGVTLPRSLVGRADHVIE